MNKKLSQFDTVEVAGRSPIEVIPCVSRPYSMRALPAKNYSIRALPSKKFGQKLPIIDTKLN